MEGLHLLFYFSNLVQIISHVFSMNPPDSPVYEVGTIVQFIS